MPAPNADVQVNGGPTLVVGHVAQLPNNALPDPADMAPLEVGHSTGLTVNAGQQQGTGWIVWLRYPLVDGESAAIEIHRKDPGGDWVLADTNVANSQAVLGPRGVGPYVGFSITNEQFTAGTQIRINCTQVSSPNWLYLAAVGGD